MEKINDGGPAFPLPLGNENIDPSVAGMSLRDYFAAKAMQAHVPGWMDTTDGVRSLADDAYKIADAMLKAREVQS